MTIIAKADTSPEECFRMLAENQKQRKVESDKRDKIARALAARYIERGNARVTGSTYTSWDEMPWSFRGDFYDDASAVLAALAAASSKPDTDTPVDPGVEGVINRIAEIWAHAEGFDDMAKAGTLPAPPIWVADALVAEHWGDCTKQPCTCMTCHAQEAVKVARWLRPHLIAALAAKPIAGMDDKESRS